MRRGRRGLTLVLAMTVGSLALSAVSASAHGTRVPKYAGDAPGSVTCSLSATVTFSPPLTNAGGGTAPSTTKGSLRSCKTTNSDVTITVGTISGSLAAANSPSCTTLASLVTAASLSIKWKGTVVGAIGATTYGGKAAFTPSLITSPAESVTQTDGNSDQFTLPAVAHTASVTSSFAGGVRLNATINETSASLAAVCRDKAEGGAGNGLKKVLLSGSITLGASAGTTLNGVQALATDAQASYCGVQASGTIRCWGDNASGELGDGSTTTSSIDMPVSGITTAVAVTSDGDHSYCALLSSQAVDCWGLNVAGELGNGTMTSSSVPVAVSGLGSVASVTSGGDNSYCALLTTGAIDCWGTNNTGQLGNGSTTSSAIPVPVTSITTASALVNDGGDAYCALLSSGTVSCWGANTFGQLGNGSTRNSTVPIAVMALTGVAGISSDGDESFCALLATQAVDCWGANFTGELGNGTTTASPVPVPVTGLGNVMTVVDDGAESYCALLASAAVECWGYNAFGQLGNGTTTNSSVPVNVSGITTAAAVTSDGENSYCALLESGAGNCWGANFAGELGNGTTTASSIPVTVTGLVFAVTIAGGGHPAGVGEHAYCAIVTSGRVMCWGSNQFGELGNATRTASSVPVIVTGP